MSTRRSCDPMERRHEHEPKELKQCMEHVLVQSEEVCNTCCIVVSLSAFTMHPPSPHYPPTSRLLTSGCHYHWHVHS